MNNKSLLGYFLVLCTVFLSQSCDIDADDSYTEGNLSWQSTTRISAKAVKDKETFIWYHDLLSGEDYWGNDKVELNMKLVSDLKPEEFSTIDIYIVAEEKDGYNYSAPYDSKGKLLKTVDMPSTGEFSLELAATDAYALFANEFLTDRSEVLAAKGDIFLVYWVLNRNDGSKLDSRDHLNYERYPIIVRVEDYAPPVWEGTFEYEWIECSNGAVNWGGVFVGQTGTVNIVNLGEGKYSMTNLLWNYYYGSAGYIYYDFISGLTYVEGSYNERWYISNIDGPSMDIRFWYYYSDAYDETGTVRFTRTDGNNWPTNIYTDDN